MRTSLRRASVPILWLIANLPGGEISAQQPAILTTTLASNQVVVFPDANNPARQSLVPGLPADATPHGVGYFGSNHALVSDGGHSRVFVVQISTATTRRSMSSSATRP